jgi:hypothetical protein
MTAQIGMFAQSAATLLDAHHYLGARGARGRLVYEDAHGAIVFSSPSARRIPAAWLELSRWCLLDGKGSIQWSVAVEWIRRARPEATTIVSYSDPSVGHSGALYRACNWIWAPTWHVLREPPTGAGIRGGKPQRAKHRWVYLLRPDDSRQAVLSLKDDAVAKRFPFASYVEPTWRRGRPVLTEMDRYRRWATSIANKEQV